MPDDPKSELDYICQVLVTFEDFLQKRKFVDARAALSYLLVAEVRIESGVPVGHAGPDMAEYAMEVLDKALKDIASEFERRVALN